MDTFIQVHEAAIRLGFFLGIFAVMALWEPLAPCRVLTVFKTVRWVNNLGLVALNTLVLRLLFPAGGGHGGVHGTARLGATDPTVPRQGQRLRHQPAAVDGGERDR